jgi:hypothetical protein
MLPCCPSPERADGHRPPARATYLTDDQNDESRVLHPYGDIVAGKDAPPPQLSQDELTERRRRAAELASAYRSEFL